MLQIKEKISRRDVMNENKYIVKVSRVPNSFTCVLKTINSMENGLEGEENAQNMNINAYFVFLRTRAEI